MALLCYRHQVSACLLADGLQPSHTALPSQLQELLGQCGHYSERVRKDALQGLGQLLAAHPGA